MTDDEGFMDRLTRQAVWLEILPFVDDSELRAYTTRFEALVFAWGEFKAAYEKHTYTVLRSFRQIPIMLRTITSAFGAIDNLILSAVLNWIETVMYSLLTMHRMADYASGGIAVPFTTFLSYLAIATASLGIWAAMGNHEENKKSFDSMTRAIESMETTFWQLRWTYLP